MWPAGAAVPWDMIVTFAAIEQAGMGRVWYCPEALYVYAYQHSHEFAHGPGEERAIEKVIRARKPYERVGAL